MTRPCPTGYNRGMEPHFKQGESLGAGTQRILEMQLVAALEHLQSPPEKRDDGIHECRKCLKYARALLRLVSKGMSKSAFRKWNTTLRDAARCVSGLRDATALLECLDAVAAELGLDDDGRVPFLACREALSQQAARESQEKPVSAEGAAEKASLLLSGILTTPHDPELGRGRETRVLRAGLRRSHELGQRAMTVLRKKGDIEAVHEWRKRAKDLRYQIAIIGPAWPAVCGAMEEELHRLTDCLGRLHDLDLVEKALAGLPSGAVPEEALAAVRAGMRQSADTAYVEALRLGARLYGNPPEEFAGNITEWWRLWRDEAAPKDRAVKRNGQGKKHE